MASLGLSLALTQQFVSNQCQRYQLNSDQTATLVKLVGNIFNSVSGPQPGATGHNAMSSFGANAPPGATVVITALPSAGTAAPAPAGGRPRQGAYCRR